MIHILNRTATSSLKDLTPIEAIKTLTNPQLQMEPRVRGEKFNPRAEEGIIVGFEDNSIYRI